MNEPTKPTPSWSQEGLGSGSNLEETQVDESALGAWESDREPTEPWEPTALSVPPPDLRSIPRNIGRFRVLRMLGQGGFGKVYLAFDDELVRQVAIKVPHPHRIAGPDDVRSYLAEARALASLDHPHIVPVHDVARSDDGLCYVVSKYIEGSDLAVRIRTGRLSARGSAELIAIVAEALHHAHTRGVIHRDVKPANILLDISDRPFLADFGLAQRDEDFGTGTGLAGTPAYMSPEQARGEGHRVDGRSDIFSLGAVFYELLTGRKAFEGLTPRHLLEQIARTEVIPPRQVDDAIPREPERVCLKALSKRAADRYATALDLADDLRKYLETETTSALVPSLSMGYSPDETPSPPPSPRSSTGGGTDPSSRWVHIVPKGLRSFDGQDADFFLELLPGPRDRDGLPDSLRFWKTRIEAADPDASFKVGLIYGPSGCGKSSLVKAGLLPRLAPRVVPLYVEAAPDETETRLLKALRRLIPDAAPGLGLAGTLASLRRGQGVAPGRKVLLVLDQFEQWLFAKGCGGGEELIAALRQCDGERVQAVVLVRDDFWLAASRFMREVEVRLVEGENSALVDLFDPPHARKVLASFGRAYRILPDRRRDWTPDHRAFLDLAVAGLSRDGKVIPVRLALFAEMTKSKPWTPDTLRAVGGTQGVGVTFLEETFSSPSAPPEHRLHHRAAQAVLKALLPRSGTGIKGEMRSEAELRDAAGYAGRPRDFQDLIRILDPELRLITPTDPESTTAEAPADRATQKMYQLAHDYLVQPIQDWLTRKQRETRRGRAELRLAERASDWAAQPGRRYLLSAWELLSTLVLTRRRLRTVPEGALVDASLRRHAARGIAYAAVAACLAVAGLAGFGRYEARALRDRIADAATDDVPSILPRLAPFRRWLDPLLTEETTLGTDPGTRRVLNARLALLPADPGQVSPLLDRMLTAEPREFLIIRAALRPYRKGLSSRLWAIAADPVADRGRRLRAVCVLADYEPGDARHGSEASPTVSLLMSQSASMLSHWVEALRPIGPRLIDPLTRAFFSPDSPDDHYIAACALADYLRDEPNALLPLALGADPHQLAVLIPALASHLGRTVPALEARLAAPPDPTAADPLRATENAAIILLGLGAGERAWPRLGTGADLTLRTRLIHDLGIARVSPEVLSRRLDATDDVSARQAIILALGEYPQESLTPGGQSELGRRLLAIFGDDPDPGVHSAAGWVLRRWDYGADLAKIDRRSASAGPVGGRRWFVNRHGLTMAVVRGPVQSSGARQEAFAVTIPRSFAVGTTEVTLEQFRTVVGSPAPDAVAGASGELPAGSISWYDAARFCRRLSEREGLPEDQMCYPPAEEIVEGFVPYPDYLRRRGYRLPTEVEWVYACRAGSPEEYPFGNGQSWLPRYAWTVQNTEGPAQRVGLLKPNGLGLFDILGNLYEWCEGPFPKPTKDAPAEDIEITEAVQGSGHQRGGAYDSRLGFVSFGDQNPHLRVVRSRPVGFRVAKTCD